MNEPDVTLTNLALATLCAGFAIDLRRHPARSAPWLFAATAAAALAGAAFHGFARDLPLLGAVTWRLVILGLGVVGFCLARVTLWVRRSREPSRAAGASLWVALAAYAAVALAGDGFLIGVAAYLVPLGWLGLESWRRWRRARAAWAGVLTASVLLGVAAFPVQALRLHVHPDWFTADAVYHVVMGASLACAWYALRRAAREAQLRSEP